MAEIRFSCQACHQHINCDEAWAGHQIQCPVCSKTITVPAKVTATASGAHGAAAPAASAAPASLVPKVPEKSSLALSQNAQQPAPAAQKHIPIRNLAAPPPKKEGPWKSIGIVAVVLVILGAGGYFGWPYVSKMINKEEAPAAAAPVSPRKPKADAPPAEASTPPATPVAEMAPGMPPSGQEATAAPAVTNVAQTGPVIPAVHTLEIASARIPSGRVNGKVSGAAFLPEIVRIDALGSSQVLRFCEGDMMSPDREILIYLKLKPGEKLEGLKIDVSEDLRRGIPQVAKRWKTNPKYAPTTRNFGSGYVMKLELTEHSKGIVKGKIYIALPDNELTVAGGNFAALTAIPKEGVLPPTVSPNSPTANPAPGQPPVESFGGQRVPNDFQRRYGVQ